MCWKCKAQIDLSEKIYRGSTCGSCGADLHCCRNCMFYDKGSHYDCRENILDFVAEKERANFCDFFVPMSNFSAEQGSAAARSALSALFGEAGTALPEETSSAQDAFNALFGD